MIGFFGGCFDPVHYGHLKTATQLSSHLMLAELFLMPCAYPVHKNKLSYNSKQRLHMLYLAVQEFTQLSIDSDEIDSNKPYTIDSLKRIKQKYKNTPTCLIMGMDSFSSLNTWKDWQKFNKYTNLVVVNRQHYQIKSGLTQLFKPTNTAAEFVKQPCGALYFTNTKITPINISSSEIRKKISNKQKLGGLMSYPIIDYINTI